MTKNLSERIEAAIECINDALAAHQKGHNAPFSPKLLAQIQHELQAMRSTLQSRNFAPVYPRFLLDWPGDEQLVRELIQLAYDYKKGLA